VPNVQRGTQMFKLGAPKSGRFIALDPLKPTDTHQEKAPGCTRNDLNVWLKPAALLLVGPGQRAGGAQEDGEEEEEQRG
jgi:hypothetical protein